MKSVFHHPDNKNIAQQCAQCNVASQDFLLRRNLLDPTHHRQQGFQRSGNALSLDRFPAWLHLLGVGRGNLTSNAPNHHQQPHHQHLYHHQNHLIATSTPRNISNNDSEQGGGSIGHHVHHHIVTILILDRLEDLLTQHPGFEVYALAWTQLWSEELDITFCKWFWLYWVLVKVLIQSTLPSANVWLYSLTDLNNSESEEPRPKNLWSQVRRSRARWSDDDRRPQPGVGQFVAWRDYNYLDGREIKQRATRCWRALSPLATISGNDLGRRLPRLQRQASYHGGGGGGGGRDVTLGKVKQQQTIKNNKQFQGKLGQLPPRRWKPRQGGPATWRQTRSKNEEDDDDGLLKIMMMVIDNNVSSIAMKLIIGIPVEHKMTSWFLWSWTQMFWLQLIMEMMIVDSFNCCSQFSVPKWQKLAQPMRGCFALSFSFKEPLVGWLGTENQEGYLRKKNTLYV